MRGAGDPHWGIMNKHGNPEEQLGLAGSQGASAGTTSLHGTRDVDGGEINVCAGEGSPTSRRLEDEAGC